MTASLSLAGHPGLDFVLLVFAQIAVVCGLAWVAARGYRTGLAIRSTWPGRSPLSRATSSIDWITGGR